MLYMQYAVITMSWLVQTADLGLGPNLRAEERTRLVQQARMHTMCEVCLRQAALLLFC